MAASCCPSHGRFCLILLLAGAAAVVSSGSGAAALGDGGSSDVKLHVDSSCLTPQEHKHGAATGTRMPIVHQHGPCSPLTDKHGKPPSDEEILAADQRRVDYIHRRVSETTGQARPKRAAPPVQLQPAPLASSAASANLPASSGDALGTGNYVVTIGLGTPEERLTVVFDTGSDTTWVQCQPCVTSCYRQKEPLFTPANSSTYANISCSSSYCSDLDVRGCSGGHCLYRVRYGDGSETVGFYAQDTLTLASDAVKVRVRRAEPRAVRAGGGADGTRPRQDVADGAGVRQVQRRVLLLPPGDAVRDWVPGPRPRRCAGGGERAPHADADRQGADLLLRGADGHQGGRARAVHPGLCLLRRRRDPGLRDGDHAPAPQGVRAAAVRVRQGHGGFGLQEGSRDLVPGHLLRPHGGPGQGAPRGVAGVPGRRDPGCGRVGDPVHGGHVAGVPGVRAQQRRYRRGHRREHAAENVRGGARSWQEAR
ncbi:hypothetical protein PVAP13_9KG130600 [Panicum virgatum]|uniref:Peptidase A1 domain-containing protein n=1 Tax=Panicum virgatum TaxID=38727 RepID=A0A8T0NJB8_PANVG|nr:hypothetical protein PVAP13_9KG130600 [Panicum virgatum]